MLKEGKFGVQEAVCLIVIAMSNKVLFAYPATIIRFAANSAWLMTLISCLSAMILFAFTYLLLKRFPGKNLIEIFNITFGRFISFLIALSFVIAILFCSAILLREFTDIIREYIFFHTPPSFIMAAMLLVVCVAAYLGLETIARFAKLIAYFALVSFIGFIAMAAPLFNTTHLYPIMGYGADVNLVQGIFRTCTYSEVVFIALWAGVLQGSRYIKKSAYLSLIISGLIISATLLSVILLFSYPLAEEQLSPLYVLTRQINLGQFLQNLDPLFLFLWFITTVISISAEFYTGLSVYCKAFRLQNMRPMILPAAVIVFAVSFIPKDFTAVTDALVFIRTFGIFLVFGTPLAALIVSILRKKRGEEPI